MDFRHLIVTCLFSMLRLSFENQKNKKNYAIFLKNIDLFYCNYSANNYFLFEPRRIHRLPLLLLISSEFIGKRYAEFAEA